MSKSSSTYKEYSFSDHGEVYQVLEKAFAHFNIAYYLIGANARDVYLYKAGSKPERLTGDIDFAVMVPDMVTYQNIFEYLIVQGFKTTQEPYRLIYLKTNTIIDVMPYGKIEQQYTVHFDKRDITLSVLGYTEVAQQKESFTLPETTIEIPISPLEGLIILKLVSWSEKPARQKDLDDIAHLLKESWELLEEEAYAQHQDLFIEGFNQTRAAARILGRRMKPILAQNDKLHSTVITILMEAINPALRTGNLEITLAKTLRNDLEETRNILSEMVQGILE